MHTNANIQPRLFPADGFARLPWMYNEHGLLRRVGVELEFAEVGVAPSAAAVAAVFGGDVEIEGTYTAKVQNTPFGDFSIEIDTSILKERKYEPLLETLGMHREELNLSKLEGSLLQIFSTIVPFEIVSPPLPLDELHRIEELRHALHRLGARGTKASLRYAFGLHFNIERPGADPEILLNILKAYLLLGPWLRHTHDIDFSRRVTHYINPFPARYAQLVLDPSYRPTLEQIMSDYIEHNPTRNRGLDLLPLFGSYDMEPIRRLVDDARLVKPRPAFHYRLPNCLIDDPAWTIGAEWSLWTAVEHLAADEARLARLGERYFENIDGNLGSRRWLKVIEEQL